MKLRFYARGTDKVSDPQRPPRTGQPASYVGRVWDPVNRAHPATQEPYEIESGTPAAARLIKVISRDSTLWAADTETARECRVDFVPVTFSDGTWIASAPKKPNPSGDS